MTYILITPIKNEQENLLQLKESILSQSVQPVLWVIVDSGSTDSSYTESRNIFEKYEWIHVIRQKKFLEQGYSYMNFSQAINEGFEYLDSFCAENKINYSFVGKTDATPSLEPKYFEELLKTIKDDSKLGFVCGTQIFCFDSSKEIALTPVFGIKNTAFNDIRLYRKKFFKEINGYPLSYSPDTVLQIKASNRGWNYKISQNARFTKNRLGGLKVGKWKGFILKGKGMHFLGYHPLLVLINSCYSIFVFPRCYQGSSMIIGYMYSIFTRQKKIDDKEVLDYFWNKRLKEILGLQK